MLWLGRQRGFAVDWLTQRWVELSGERVQLAEAPWLDGPTGDSLKIGADFFSRWARDHGYICPARTGREGLLRDGLVALNSATFDAAKVDPRIDAFYERTAEFELAIRSQWHGPFRFLGESIARIFSKRLAQLNLPLREEDSNGLESHIESYVNTAGDHRTAWVRSSRATNLPIFVGQYGVSTIPGVEGPCVQVVFPLPNGNAIVLLRPRAEQNGGLALVSDGKRFGDTGFYFTVVASEGERWVKYVATMKEELHLKVSGENIAAEHCFRVFGVSFLTLRYQIRPKSALDAKELLSHEDKGASRNL